MNEEPNGKNAGGEIRLAMAGGVLIAAGLLLITLLVAGLAGRNSSLGSAGNALFEAFSWAAWALPLWPWAVAWFVFRQDIDARKAISLASLALPFLSFAAFARILDLSNPLFPSFGPSRTRLAALAFAAACTGISVLILWFATSDRKEPVEAAASSGLDEKAPELDSETEPALGAMPEPSLGDVPDHSLDDVPDHSLDDGGLVEEGHRPGLDFAEAPEPEESELEAEPPTAAGRRIESIEGNPEADYSFSVPNLPPPPRLRSLSAGEPRRSVPAATPDPAATSIPAATPDPAEMDGAIEAPVPLFFLDEPGDGPVRTPASFPAGDQDGDEAERPSEIARGGPEIISIPPRPAAEAAGVGAAGTATEKVAIVQRILARRKKPDYLVPVGDLLLKYPDGEYWIVDDKTRRSAEVLRETLAEFGIEAEVTGIRKGPVITMFEILPAPGVRLSKIANLSDNIALRLAASSVRIVAPIPGKHAVGIEVPNERRSIVSLREIVESEVFVGAKAEVPVALAKDIAGEVQFIDLTQTPHLLIAGSTGSGKSVCVNSIILSILFRRSPEEVRLILIDPKIVELKLYNDVPHLLTPVITEPKRAFQALQYCICEMERRYAMLDRVGVRDIRSYNRKVKEKALAQERLPYIVVIIDEFADLMATTGKELESTLARLAAMSRAVGIHLVLATQRPSIDVITGLIKANIPSRVAFMVASKFDSRIIIDMVGAEKLLGKGDMLFASAWDPFPIRMQGAFVSEEEVEKAVEFIKTLGEPEYIDEDIFIDDDEDAAESNLFDDGDGDPLFEQALEIVLQQGKASASYIQRKLKIGYNRAARIVELMEEKGIVGKAQGSKPRDLVRNPEIAHVRNPEISGLRAAMSDSPGYSRAALKERGAVEESGSVDAADSADRAAGGAAAGASLPPLVARVETAPGAGLATVGTAASGGGLDED